MSTPPNAWHAKGGSNDAAAKEHSRQTLNASAGIAGCVKLGPPTVRGTLKVFFLLLVSFLVTAGGVAAVAFAPPVAFAPLSLPAPFAESSSASAVACGKHNENT